MALRKFENVNMHECPLADLKNILSPESGADETERTSAHDAVKARVIILGNAISQIFTVNQIADFFGGIEDYELTDKGIRIDCKGKAPIQAIKERFLRNGMEVELKGADGYSLLIDDDRFDDLFVNGFQYHENLAVDAQIEMARFTEQVGVDVSAILTGQDLEEFAKGLKIGESLAVQEALNARASYIKDHFGDFLKHLFSGEGSAFAWLDGFENGHSISFGKEMSLVVMNVKDLLLEDFKQFLTARGIEIIHVQPNEEVSGTSGISFSVPNEMIEEYFAEQEKKEPTPEGAAN